jgi:hypothetical protein
MESNCFEVKNIHFEAQNVRFEVKNICYIFTKFLQSDFDAIYSVYKEYTEYSVFQILQKYKSRNILPFAGP